MRPASWPAALLLTVALLAAPGAVPALGAGQAGTATAAAAKRPTTVQFEKQLLRKVNARRARIGCRDLASRKPLTKAARQHSNRMAQSRELSHRLAREAPFWKRITRAGYRNWKQLAENIAYGTPSPQLIFNSWMGSSSHRRNIEDCRFRHVGVGVRYGGGLAWVTMDFGRR